MCLAGLSSRTLRTVFQVNVRVRSSSHTIAIFSRLLELQIAPGGVHVVPKAHVVRKVRPVRAANRESAVRKVIVVPPIRRHHVGQRAIRRCRHRSRANCEGTEDAVWTVRAVQPSFNGRAHRFRAFERAGPLDEVFRAVDLLVDPPDQRRVKGAERPSRARL